MIYYPDQDFQQISRVSKGPIRSDNFYFLNKHMGIRHTRLSQGAPYLLCNLVGCTNFFYRHKI